MLKIITVLSLLVASVLGAGLPLWEGRVVGGSTATPGQFPWQVSVRTWWNEHFCGGTVIGSRYILTAAHCFDDLSPGNYLVVIGAHHRRDDGQQLRLDFIVRHEEFNRQNLLENDVAIMRTIGTIPGAANRQIPISASPSNHGQNVTVSGWGYSRVAGGNESPEYLQYLNKRVISRDECQRRLGRTIPPSTLCTESPAGQGSCMGDSGGPLVMDWPQQVVGIVSWGIPCALGFPDMYGDVFNLRPWIMDVLRQI